MTTNKVEGSILASLPFDMAMTAFQGGHMVGMYGGKKWRYGVFKELFHLYNQSHEIGAVTPYCYRNLN